MYNDISAGDYGVPCRWTFPIDDIGKPGTYVISY